ncbi:MBL fold metallo-hydrolase [Flagellimonas sp.]|uniref:MBL fold metallo-hydrolase n=1 Tax=Flagellimonas sp. TaxID=2058762 RepID=UPI003B5AD658
MTITFLGTGTSQGIPVIGSDHPVCLSSDPKDKRLRVSVLISWKDYNYVIDCGPDFRQQMLANPISRLDGILFTHEHTDHTIGLDDIRPFFFRQGNIPIYASEKVIDSLKQRFDYVFANENRYPGAPAVEVNTVEKDKSIVLGDIEVVPIEAHHDKVRVFGYRFGDFVYLTDVKRVDEDQIKKIMGAKILVVNALRQQPHQSHFNLEEAITFAQKIGAEKTYFTHISYLLGFHEEVEKELPDNIFLAYDNLQLKI